MADEPSGDIDDRLAALAFAGERYEEAILECCPDVSERDIAVLNVRQASLWARMAVELGEV